MRFLKILLGLILVCLLTAVTQIGGVVFLISILTFGLIDKRLSKKWIRSAAKLFSFATLYLLFVFIIVPLAANPFGRVPLPILENGNLKPVSIWTCLLNRNYVRPQLRDIAYKVAEDISKKFPGTTINYLDANFPFINKFPLLPHLSHCDGKKLDLSFQYNDSRTGKITNHVPSLFGYGICEEPKEGEENIPEECAKKGFWQYNLLRENVSQANKDKFAFDNKLTKELVNSFASHNEIGKIFIEPHLKTRLGLTNPKIRFHGCQAVRHDDHIHIQLK
jgi:energy-coupling factor transporter transmembrane protein EcfT